METTTYLSSMYLIVRYLHDGILCKAPWINSSRRRLAATTFSYTKKKEGKKEKERERERENIRFILLRACGIMREQTTPRYVYPRAKLTRYLLNDANITGRLFLINKKIIANTCVDKVSTSLPLHFFDASNFNLRNR